MKKYFTDRKLFVYRIIGIMLIFIFLVCDFVLVLETKSGIYSELPTYGERLSHYYSYFTTQSNYLVFMYFIFYLFQKKFKNTKPDFIIRIMVTVYITMTMIVFWTGLFVQGDLMKNMSVYEWISTFILHTIMPLVMILSYIMTAGDIFYKFESHHKANYWLICLYPFLYLLCILVRGYIRHVDKQPSDTLFPYFFLNFYTTNGFSMLAVGTVLIFTLCTSFQYFYIWINNLFYFRKQIKVNNITKVDQIKILLNIKQYRQLDHKGKIAMILAIVVAIFNIVFSILYYVLRNVWSKILNYSYENKIVLKFTIIIIVFSIITLIFVILGLANFYWARIVVGFCSIALICFNWIWIAGPIFDITIATLCLNNHKYSKADLDIYLATHNKTNKLKLKPFPEQILLLDEDEK
ncbi:hypothetical protein [Spiroplasma endosymbiont of Stenodema calcarata]|uniref:hypothetical protein n=1 Tax=Spiroplasma endosymbiont of Stenodema calcarata TaxID=3139328 RepID=UPI003CCB020D